jgi:hypothetical protein
LLASGRYIRLIFWGGIPPREQVRSYKGKHLAFNASSSARRVSKSRSTPVNTPRFVSLQLMQNGPCRSQLVGEWSVHPTHFLGWNTASRTSSLLQGKHLSLQRLKQCLTGVKVAITPVNTHHFVSLQLMQHGPCRSQLVGEWPVHPTHFLGWNTASRTSSLLQGKASSLQRLKQCLTGVKFSVNRG